MEGQNISQSLFHTKRKHVTFGVKSRTSKFSGTFLEPLLPTIYENENIENQSLIQRKKANMSGVENVKKKTPLNYENTAALREIPFGQNIIEFQKQRKEKDSYVKIESIEGPTYDTKINLDDDPYAFIVPEEEGKKKKMKRRTKKSKILDHHSKFYDEKENINVHTPSSQTSLDSDDVLNIQKNIQYTHGANLQNKTVFVPINIIREKGVRVVRRVMSHYN